MSTLTLTGGNFEDNDEEYMTLDELLDQLERERMAKLGESWWDDEDVI